MVTSSAIYAIVCKWLGHIADKAPLTRGTIMSLSISPYLRELRIAEFIDDQDGPLHLPLDSFRLLGKLHLYDSTPSARTAGSMLAFNPHNCLEDVFLELIDQDGLTSDSVQTLFRNLSQHKKLKSVDIWTALDKAFVPTIEWSAAVFRHLHTLFLLDCQHHIWKKYSIRYDYHNGYGPCLCPTPTMAFWRPSVANLHLSRTFR
jgi:hypothetical protein